MKTDNSIKIELSLTLKHRWQFFRFVISRKKVGIMNLLDYKIISEGEKTKLKGMQQ